MSEIFAKVLLPLALNEAFSYKAESDIECGDVVCVEFGRKKIWGLVIEVTKDAPQQIAPEKIKTILEKNSRLKFSENQIKFIEKLASYNLASRGLVLRAFLGILNSDKVKKVPTSWVQKVDVEKFRLKKLLPKQQEIFDQLSKSVQPSEPVIFDSQSRGSLDIPAISLLDGVTGSGKTEIYFALIARILSSSCHPEHSEGSQKFGFGVQATEILRYAQDDKSSKQVLILLPEIALTSQLLLRFEEQFGFKPALWHSKISKKDKREIFYGIAAGSVKVLIGARSALLLPFKNLELIIIDEEHDTSFKQEDVFNFHARDMAILKAQIENFSVVLASATPSLESYANAISGKYRHFVLEQSFGQKNEIELIDLRREKLPKDQFISQKLREELAQVFAEKKQAMIFLNRRGYAPVTLCKTCGHKYQCGDCDFHLVLHKSKEKLICHHCGHQEKLIHECKFCGEKDTLTSIGVGVEKVAEEVKNLFPESKIALVTSDNVTSFADVDKLVAQILNHEIDFIIGTQMIVKGHDFPNLSLVGIVDADAMLYSSELRALEKTYQILTQVIGRAGRRESKGKVIVQTYNPQNFIFEQIIKSDKKSFYTFEINNRRSLDLPPFSRFVKFEVSSFNESEARSFAKKLIQHFPLSDKIELFGPAPAPLQRLKNRHHFLVNLKADRKINVQKLITDVFLSLEIPKSVRIRIDVDPV
jgi:primosomal protein N' (replication factor Y) (superfamily II helicase)